MPDNDPAIPSATDSQQPRRGTEGTAPLSGAEGVETSSQDAVRDPVAKAIADAEYKARQQMRTLEKKIAEYEARDAAVEEAKLSEIEKANKHVADWQEKYNKLETEHQEYIIRNEVRTVAKELGLNPSLALRILKHELIERDEETNDPTNIEALLRAAMEEFGLTSPQATTQQPANQPQQQQATSPAPNIGATNAPRRAAVAGANGVFRADEIPSLTDTRLWKRG